MWERIRGWGSRVWSCLRLRRLSDDFGAELESHVAMLTEENQRQGMTVEEARRQALVRLGGVSQLRESYRDQRGLPLLDRIAQDVSYAVRMFRKNSAFTLFAGTTLALGIAATSAVFSIVDAVLLRPLPYRDASRLVMVWQDDTAYGFPRNNGSPWAFRE